MAITYHSVTGQSVATTVANVIISKPTGVAAGDFLIAHCWANSATADWSAPAGWTLQAFNNTQNSSAFFWRVADGSEGSTFTFTRSGNLVNQAGVEVVRLSGVGSIQDYSLSHSTGTTIALPSLTAAANNYLWQMVTRVSGTNAFTAPGTVTPRYTSASGTTVAAAGGDEIVSAGATGTRTWTTASGTTRGLILALNEAQTNVSGSDGGSLTVSESSAVTVGIESTDTGSLGVSDSASTFKDISASDDVSVSVSESTSMLEFAELSASDEGSLALSESVGASVGITSSDTGSIAVEETTESDISLESDDGGSLHVADPTLELSNVSSAEDDISVSVSEDTALDIFDEKFGSDTNSISVVEEASIFVVFESTDEGSIGTTEEHSSERAIQSSDSGSLAVDETVSTVLLISSTDTSSIGASDEYTAEFHKTAEDSASFAVDDESELIDIGMEEVEASDEGSISVTENANVFDKKPLVYFDSGHTSLGSRLEIEKENGTMVEESHIITERVE